MRRVIPTLTLAAAVAACGGGDDGTGPSYGPPTLTLVNGVTSAAGPAGMTAILEGTDLAEAQYGTVFFLNADGNPIEATTSEWANDYILAQVPQETATESKVWVETSWGVSDSLDFRVTSAATFSPSQISWSRTTDLPQALEGLGAVFVPVLDEASPAKLIFTTGGTPGVTDVAGTAVYRGFVQETGQISAWEEAENQLPSGRAYHAAAAATAYTARLETGSAAAHLYVIGGRDELGDVVGTVLYATVAPDGSLGGWQTTTALPQPLHSARARTYRGYLYVVGGATVDNTPVANVYRAAVNGDGSLGAWEQLTALPATVAHHGLVNFGPYLYVIGGDTTAVAPGDDSASGGETAAAYLAQIDLRDGSIGEWSATEVPAKARSKHGLMAAGASVVATSGHYAGQDGSSENTYATIQSDGTLAAWAGATGGSTIKSTLGYSLYNAAAISFTDAQGEGHVVVLGGGQKSATGGASAAVVYY